MDAIDNKIIEMLAKGADVTATELSRELHFSIPAINKRIRTLKKEGIIKNFTVLTDNKKVGKPILSFVLITLKSVEHTEPFFSYVEGDCDILECYAITGEYDCLIKICSQSIEQLDQKITYLKQHKGIIKSNTMLSLTNYKYSTTIFPN